MQVGFILPEKMQVVSYMVSLSVCPSCFVHCWSLPLLPADVALSCLIKANLSAIITCTPDVSFGVSVMLVFL